MSDSNEHHHEHKHHDHHHDAKIHSNGTHSHTHGVIDPAITTSERGIWAIKWSFIGLMLTALFQVIVVYFTGSIALLADTIHNFGDAATAIPLWIAFRLAVRKPTKRFGYGLGRVEDIAGIIIVLIILFSAVVAAYESIYRIINHAQISGILAVMIASVIGFAGNEAVAVFRIKVGKEINSVALIADGYHARTDGFTSLAVLAGAIGVWLGFPLADPIVGILISAAIFRIVWQSAKAVIIRALDGVEPEIIDEILHAAHHVKGVVKVTDIRARWIGHKLHAEINIAVQPSLSVPEGHDIAKEVNHQLLHHINYLYLAVIHIDPIDEAGEVYHKIELHSHDGLPAHSHS
jgi:cation diffusion facilitator family transporter